MRGFHIVVSVVRIFLIRQKRQIRQIQLYGNQALDHSLQQILNFQLLFVTQPES